MVVDAHIASYQAAATAIALGRRLRDRDDLSRLAEQARATGQALNGWIVATEPDDPTKILFNTRDPIAGAQPCDGDFSELSAAYKMVNQTHRPAVSDMFIGRKNCAPDIAVLVPAMNGDQIFAIVAFVFTADTLSDWLSQEHTLPGSTIAIRDGHDVIIARSADRAAYIGRKPSSWVGQAGEADNGLIFATSEEGEKAVFAFTRPRETHQWRVVVRMPADTLIALSSGPRWWMALCGVLVLIALALTLVYQQFGRREARLAHDQLDQLLTDIPAIIYVNEVAADGTYSRRFMSRSAAYVTGWPWPKLDQSGGVAALAALPGVEDMHPWRVEYFQEALTRGIATRDYQIHHGDGTWHWMRSIARGLERRPDGSGMVVGFIVDVEDEYQIKSQVRQLEKFAALGEMSSRVGHEISQPLAAISMAAENGALSLERKTPNIAAALDKFARIQTQIDRVTLLVRHISSFARKVNEADIGPIDLAAVVANAVAVVDERCHQELVDLTVIVPAELPPVRGIALLLEQVVVNIAVNACDAYRDQPERTPRPLRIEAMHTGAGVVLRIEDEAGGVPQHLIDRIFEPFVTSKPPGKGTGLGLSISLSTVTRFGGRISVENVGGGARFEILLRAFNPTPAPAGTENAGHV